MIDNKVAKIMTLTERATLYPNNLFRLYPSGRVYYYEAEPVGNNRYRVRRKDSIYHHPIYDGTERVEVIGL